MPDPIGLAVPAPRCYFEDVEPGQRFASGGRTMTDADIRMYLGATGTDHPNHSDEEYCRAHPLLEGVCAPGVLVLGVVDAFIAATVTRHLAVSMNYGHDRIRYLRPVYVGDTVRVDIEVTQCSVRDEEWGIVRLDVTGRNQKDQPVLHDVHALIVQRRTIAD